MRKMKLGKRKWPEDDRDVLVSVLSLALSSTLMTRLVGWDIATLESMIGRSEAELDDDVVGAGPAGPVQVVQHSSRHTKSHVNLFL
jgi:hypothetical protein